MRDWRGRRYWLVGASEGVGAALADVMSRSGCELVLSARSSDRLENVAAALPGRARAVACDVTDTASVREAAEAAGDVDGVVYLAGAYWPMSAHDWDTGRVETMIDTNLTGAARVLGAVLPGMVARGAGHVVLTSSLSAYRGLPGAVGYGATKAGILNLAQGMRADLRGSGVLVQAVCPGFVRTRLTGKNRFDMPQIMEPEDAARRMFDAMGTDRAVTAFPAPFSWLFRAGRLLPTWAWNRIMPRR